MTNLDPQGSDRPEPGTGLDNGGDGDGDSCDEYAAAWERMAARMQAELEQYAAAWDRSVRTIRLTVHRME